MQPWESVAEYVVDVTMKAEHQGLTNHYADVYDASALRAANDTDLAGATAFGGVFSDRTIKACVEACARMPLPCPCWAIGGHASADA